MKLTFAKTGSKRAASPMEMFFALVSIGTLSTIALSSLHNMVKATESIALEQDVSVLNEAVHYCRQNGGDLKHAVTMEQVLFQLKYMPKRLDSENPLIASPIQVIPSMQTPGEWESDQPRAKWDPAHGRFTISHSGLPGARSFEFVETNDPIPNPSLFAPRNTRPPAQSDAERQREAELFSPYRQQK